MKRYPLVTMCVILLMLFSSCQGMGSKDALFEECYNGDISAIVGSEDSYIRSLSAFDYAAKFNSHQPLSVHELQKIIIRAVEPYTAEEIRKLKVSFQNIKNRINGFPLSFPETIHVFSESVTEAGSAYSRGNAICIPKSFMNAISQDQLDRLVAQEFFHVLMRYNPVLEADLYAIIGYRRTSPLVLEETIKALTINSPDMPSDTYVITCIYEGTIYDFAPLTYSETPFDEVSGGTYYDYLQEALIAVEITDTTTTPILIDGEPLIIPQFELSDFFVQVGSNTDYTHGPEDISADHFVMFLFDTIENYPNPDLITALGNRLKNGQ